MRTFWLISLLVISVPLKAEGLLGAVQVYSQDELLDLITENKHLDRVLQDDCQLVEDIRARADKMSVPAYQFLYGDMLLYGVCIKKDAKLCMFYIEESAKQALPAALDQLGRYYAEGKFVRKDVKRAVHYFYRAASVGQLNSQISLVVLYLQGYGGAPDYYYAYHWLHNARIAETDLQHKADVLLALLAKKMPDQLVDKAKQPLER